MRGQPARASGAHLPTWWVVKPSALSRSGSVSKSVLRPSGRDHGMKLERVLPRRKGSRPLRIDPRVGEQNLYTSVGRRAGMRYDGRGVVT